MKVSFPEIPGVLVDVVALLRGLEAESLVSAVKAAVASGSPKSSGEAAVSLHSCGLTLDVPDLLRSLGRQEMLGVVRSVVEPWAAVRNKLVQELQDLVGAPPGAGAEAAGAGGLRLPQIGSSPNVGGSGGTGAGGGGGARRPPKIPGTSSGRSKGGFGRRSASLTHLSVSSSSSSASALPAVHEDRAEVPEGDGGLMKAIRDKDVSAVKLLLARRADVNGCPGGSPLAAAIMQGTPSGVLSALLEARADVHERDDQGRSPAHLWAWNLPKSRAGLNEAQKKLTILAKGRVDLNAQLPASGDAPLHILAKVYSSLSSRVARGSAAAGAAAGGGPEKGEEEDGGAAEAERFLKGARIRIDILVNSGADVNLCNARGQRPVDLVERRFRAGLPSLGGSLGRNAGGEGAEAPVPFNEACKTGLRVSLEPVQE